MGAALRLQASFSCQRYVTRTIKLKRGRSRTAPGSGRHRQCRRGGDGWKPGTGLRPRLRERLGAEFQGRGGNARGRRADAVAAWHCIHRKASGASRWPLFKVPHNSTSSTRASGDRGGDGVTRMRLPRPMLRHREGFGLTRMQARFGQDARPQLLTASGATIRQGQFSPRLKDRKRRPFRSRRLRHAGRLPLEKRSRR